MLVAVLVVAGVLFHQEKEMSRLRAMIAELTSVPREGADTLATNSLPADFEELRQAAAEIHSLRAELAQLRLEKVDTTALQARIDKLAQEVAYANNGAANRRPDTSSVVSQAATMAQSSPEEAARWVVALPSGKDRDQAALAVIGRWSDTNPAGAAAWASQFVEGPLREQAASMVARQWGLRDWNATSGWLETLPMGSSRDAAIGAFVTSADGYDIRLALEWANRIESPQGRALRVEETARRWLHENNAAAREGIENAQLPSGMAERLLSAK